MSAAELVALFQAKGLTLATAESCTGGLIAAALTAVPGSSAVFTHGFVSYANEAKTEMLDVPESMLAAHGAVSEQVARRMAQGARAKARSDFAISVTGIAGPGGGSADKPVGTVWFGLAGPRGSKTYHRLFAGARDDIRTQAVNFALSRLLEEGDINS